MGWATLSEARQKRALGTAFRALNRALYSGERTVALVESAKSTEQLRQLRARLKRNLATAEERFALLEYVGWHVEGSYERLAALRAAARRV